MDQRQAIKHLKVGLKIVAAIIFSFAAFASVALSYIGITQGLHRDPRLAAWWALLVTTAVIMFISVRFWARWFCGIISYLAVRTTLLALFAGKVGMSYRNAIGISASMWFMAILSIHFYRRHQFSSLDQLSLTAAAICLFVGFTRLGITGNNAMLLPVALGIPLLLFSAYQKPLTRLVHKVFSRGLGA